MPVSGKPTASRARSPRTSSGAPRLSIDALSLDLLTLIRRPGKMPRERRKRRLMFRHYAAGKDSPVIFADLRQAAGHLLYAVVECCANTTQRPFGRLHFG